MAGGMEFYWYPGKHQNGKQIFIPRILWQYNMLRHILHNANFWFWYLQASKFGTFTRYTMCCWYFEGQCTPRTKGVPVPTLTSLTETNGPTHDQSISVIFWHQEASSLFGYFWLWGIVGQGGVRMSRCRWWFRIHQFVPVPVFHVKNLGLTWLCFDLTGLNCHDSCWVQAPRYDIRFSSERTSESRKCFRQQCCGEGNQLGEPKSWWHWTPRDPPWLTFASHDAWLDDVRWLHSQCNAPRLHVPQQWWIDRFDIPQKGYFPYNPAMICEYY